MKKIYYSSFTIIIKKYMMFSIFLLIAITNAQDYSLYNDCEREYIETTPSCARLVYILNGDFTINDCSMLQSDNNEKTNAHTFLCNNMINTFVKNNCLDLTKYPTDCFKNVGKRLNSIYKKNREICHNMNTFFNFSNNTKSDDIRNTCNKVQFIEPWYSSVVLVILVSLLSALGLCCLSCYACCLVEDYKKKKIRNTSPLHNWRLEQPIVQPAPSSTMTISSVVGVCSNDDPTNDNSSVTSCTIAIRSDNEPSVDNSSVTSCTIAIRSDDEPSVDNLSVTSSTMAIRSVDDNTVNIPTVENPTVTEQNIPSYMRKCCEYFLNLLFFFWGFLLVAIYILLVAIIILLYAIIFISLCALLVYIFTHATYPIYLIRYFNGEIVDWPIILRGYTKDKDED